MHEYWLSSAFEITVSLADVRTVYHSAHICIESGTKLKNRVLNPKSLLPMAFGDPV